jgi:uncharacterized protein (UPF0548 family)
VNVGLHRPDRATLARVRDAVAGAPVTYADVGATRTHVPLGYATGSLVAPIGRGRDAWAQAADALAGWRIFDAPWLAVLDVGPPEVGGTVVYAARAFGVWTVNANRVLAVEQAEDDGGAAFGFTWGTLPGHALSGEERLHVAWDRSTDEVTFEITQFSVPVGALALVPRALVERVQRRFSATAVAALRRAAA